MTKIIAGNWKMNGSKTLLNQWFEDFFNNAIQYEKENGKQLPNILICVPSIYAEYAKTLADKYNTKTKQIKVFIGCQDIHQEDTGAFTGNTSALFLNDFDLKYTIVGHSERRMYEGETDELVCKKANNAIKHNITPIICCGESLDIREKQQYLPFIENSLLKSINGLDVNNIIIAYEPVWAIGTGKVPTPDEIEEVCKYIKNTVQKHYNVKDVCVLYGGSVKSSNVNNITTLQSVDGVLVGGASLKGEEFFNIAKNSL